MGVSFERARQTFGSVEEMRSQVGRLRRSVKRLQSRCGTSTRSFSRTLTDHDMTHPERWDDLLMQKTMLEKQEKQLQQVQEQVEELINCLPNPRWRMVMRGHYLDGLSLADVAQELSDTTGRIFTPTQVYGMHYRALEAAEKLLPRS